MSEERLEEIKEQYKYLRGDLMRNDIGWLIEQAERVQELEEENKRYRELLEKIKEMTRYDDCREAEIYELVSDELEGESDE